MPPRQPTTSLAEPGSRRDSVGPVAEDGGTRAIILAAARRVLTRDPEASIDTIAQAAGVSRATFYRHLRSRAELLDALLSRVPPDRVTRVERLRDALASPQGSSG